MNKFEKDMAMRKAYKRLFSCEDGIKVLEDLKSRAYFFDSTFSPVPGRTEFHEGMRTLVLHIMEFQNVDQLVRMQEDRKCQKQ